MYDNICSYADFEVRPALIPAQKCVCAMPQNRRPKPDPTPNPFEVDRVKSPRKSVAVGRPSGRVKWLVVAGLTVLTAGGLVAAVVLLSNSPQPGRIGIAAAPEPAPADEPGPAGQPLSGEGASSSGC